jgi:hypothetical protein
MQNKALFNKSENDEENSSKISNQSLNKTNSKYMTKAEKNLCSQRSCRCPRSIESHFCNYHEEEFFYIDMAFEVDVTGICLSKSGLYKKLENEKKKILNDYFIEEVECIMKKMLITNDLNSLINNCEYKSKKRNVICKNIVIHKNIEGIILPHLCSRHLKRSLIKKISNKYYRIKYLYNNADNEIISLPSKSTVLDNLNIEKYHEINNKIRKVTKNLTDDIITNSRCRFQTKPGYVCSKIVDDFMHIAYCSTHIHHNIAILNIMKRHKILSSKILIPNLREILVSYI